jgi:hypothetical protein
MIVFVHIGAILLLDNYLLVDEDIRQFPIV